MKFFNFTIRLENLAPPSLVAEYYNIRNVSIRLALFLEIVSKQQQS